MCKKGTTFTEVRLTSRFLAWVLDLSHLPLTRPLSRNRSRLTPNHAADLLHEPPFKNVALAVICQKLALKKSHVFDVIGVWKHVDGLDAERFPPGFVEAS